MIRARAFAGLRLAAWTAGLVVAARLLLAAGSETLAVPLTSLDDLSIWVAETSPADMVVAVLRLAALAAVAYLLAATVLAVAAGLLRVRPLVAAADVLSPDIVRRLATGGSGLGLVLGGAIAGLPAPDLPGTATGHPVALTATPAGPHGRDGSAGPSTATMSQLPAATATMTPLDAVTSAATAEPSPAAASRFTPEGSADGTATVAGTNVAAAGLETAGTDIQAGADANANANATMRRIDEPIVEPGRSATMTRVSDPPAASPAAARPAAYEPTAPSAPVGGTAPASLQLDPTAWSVEPGDSLWSIAEEVTAGEDGTPAPEREVARYWQRLVAANRAHLVDPDNPDLLVPGQQVVVPPTAG